jgi:hypothetical protein
MAIFNSKLLNSQRVKHAKRWGCHVVMFVVTPLLAFRDWKAERELCVCDFCCSFSTPSNMIRHVYGIYKYY